MVSKSKTWGLILSIIAILIVISNFFFRSWDPTSNAIQDSLAYSISGALIIIAIILFVVSKYKK